MNDSLASILFDRDTTLRFKAEEFSALHQFYPDAQPRLVNIQNIRMQEIKKLNLDVFLLVDMTLDSIRVTKQKTAIKNLKASFPADRLYISFTKDKSVSETMNVTDYVLKNYFKPVSGEKYLYRSLG